MDETLQKFLNEYKRLLEITKNSAKELKRNLKDIKTKIANGTQSQFLIEKLETQSRKFFQVVYFLMESHTTVKNLFFNYSAEDRALINEYEKTSQKYYKLIKEVNDYIESNKTASDTVIL